jgi:hypothetical protein
LAEGGGWSPPKADEGPRLEPRQAMGWGALGLGLRLGLLGAQAGAVELQDDGVVASLDEAGGVLTAAVRMEDSVGWHLQRAGEK